MKKKIIVLGAGLVGKAMAIDLAKQFDVTSVDFNEEALKTVSQHGVKTSKLDFSNPELLTAAIQPFDLVVGAVPGFLGLQTAKTVIEGGKIWLTFRSSRKIHFCSMTLLKRKM